MLTCDLLNEKKEEKNKIAICFFFSIIQSVLSHPKLKMKQKLLKKHKPQQIAFSVDRTGNLSMCEQ